MKKLFLGLMFIVVLCKNTVAQAVQSNHPNIVIIFMDDMGYGDPECYNGLLYHTPNINKLAAQGIRFTNFYAAQAVCSASRASLLTGCYPNRLGISGALMPWSKTALNSNEETIATSLKKAGYTTGMVGKWHLGCKPPYLPTYFGFDEYLGLPYSNDMWPVSYDGKPITDTSDFKSRFPPLPLLDGDKPLRYIKTFDDQDELTQVYTKRAVQFIDKNKSHPFFLYMAHSMVHVPLGVSAAFKGKSKEGMYGDVMMEVDWSVGEIIKALDKAGVAKNTLVIFTSDNGPWRIFGEHAGNTGGLREGKGTSWEGGQREPCIMRWPGKIPAGIVSNNLAVTIDLFPTIARICNAALPKQKIDGVDISDVLFNKEGANPRDELVYYYQRNSLEAVRKGNWKLVFPHDYSSYVKDSVGRNRFPTKYLQGKTELSLYDLRTDPGETVDLKNQFPEIVKQLETVADKYRDMLGDDLTKTPCKECREAGKVE
ncbi:MAG: sulfatase [Bacteroidota bacterium]